MTEHPYMCLVLLLPNCALARSRKLVEGVVAHMSMIEARLIYTTRARRNAYADLWRDVVALDRLATNETAPVDSALDAVVRPKRIDQARLGRRTRL